MSDYLGKLVSRSLSPPRVVQPRLLSLFEPPRANREQILESDIEPAPPDAEQVRERSPSAVRAPQFQSLRSSEPNLQDAGQTSPAPLVRIKPEAVKRVEPREMDAGASARSRARAAGPAPAPARKSPGQTAQTPTLPFPASIETVTPEAVPPAVEPVSPVPVQAPVIPWLGVKETPGSDTAHPRVLHGDDSSAKRSRADNQKTRSSLTPEIPAPTTTEAKTPEAASPRRGDTSDRREGNQRSQPQMPPKLPSVTQTAADQRPKSLPIVPVVPASTVPSPRLLPPSQKREHAPERPSIHVTIGRVEVRATPPPARARQQVPQARAMSLDEYLRQRASGGSR
jgi:hypothetical protein